MNPAKPDALWKGSTPVSVADQADSPADARRIETRTAVPVANLATGRRLRYSIHDSSGILLLVGGAVVTPHFKELLLDRGVQEVFLHPIDAAGISARHSRLNPALGAVQLDPSWCELLETLVDTGHLFKADAGSKFVERLTQHGCKTFKSGLQESILRKHVETCSRLDQMIKAAARDETLDADEIANVVSDYLGHLADDADCVLDLMSRTPAYAGVAHHCLQMSVLGMTIAIDAHMCETDVRLVGLCGLVHDWGMTRVPEHLRNANRILNRIEFLEIQKHPTYTLDMLRNIHGLPSQVPMVCYQVHERPDGTGYPRGRRAGNIHPCALVLHVADVYVALATPRPFRPAMEPYAALEHLVREAALLSVDSGAVRSLLRVLSQFPIGSTVVLSDGRKGRVIRRNGNHYYSPIVQVLEESDGTPTNPLETSNVIDPSAHHLKITGIVTAEGRQDLRTSRETINLIRE